MHSLRLITILLCLGLLAPGLWAGQKDQASPKGSGDPKVVKQSFCPPCEMKLDPKTDQFVDVEGYRIYVCSSYCGEKVKKNPALYIKKIQDAGETPEAVPGKQASRAGHACGKCSSKNCCSGAGTASEATKK